MYVLHSPPAADDTNRLLYSFLKKKNRFLYTSSLFVRFLPSVCLVNRERKNDYSTAAVVVVDDQKRFSILYFTYSYASVVRTLFKKSAYNGREPVDLVKSLQIRHDRWLSSSPQLTLFIPTY